MTLKERVIVETYTGICMVTGEDREELHKYWAELMGRPIFTHELASKEIQEELQAKSKDDFIALCRSCVDPYNKFPYIEGQRAEIFYEGQWRKGVIKAGYRFRDGIVTVRTDGGQEISCGEARKEPYRPLEVQP